MTSYKYLNKLKGKLIVVFGASRGIGFAVSEAALEHGANVFLSGSNVERLAAAADRLRKAYPDVEEARIRVGTCDLSVDDRLENRIQQLFEQASEHGNKKIDHVVTTAGNKVNVANGITGTDLNVLNALMSIRLIAPIFVAKVMAISPYVNRTSESSITFTAGTAHLRPRKTWCIMAMISGAQQGLASGLAVDLAPIRVNVVNPGAVRTELFAAAPQQLVDKMIRDSLTNRLGEPEDIAEAYLYFMKDYSADGTSLRSDNGKSLPM